MEREVQGGTVVGFVEAKAEVKVEKPEAKPKKKK